MVFEAYHDSLLADEQYISVQYFDSMSTLIDEKHFGDEPEGRQALLEFTIVQGSSSSEVSQLTFSYKGQRYSLATSGESAPCYYVFKYDFDPKAIVGPVIELALDLSLSESTVRAFVTGFKSSSLNEAYRQLRYDYNETKARYEQQHADFEVSFAQEQASLDKLKADNRRLKMENRKLSAAKRQSVARSAILIEGGDQRLAVLGDLLTQIDSYKEQQGIMQAALEAASSSDGAAQYEREREALLEQLTLLTAGRDEQQIAFEEINAAQDEKLRALERNMAALTDENDELRASMEPDRRPRSEYANGLSLADELSDDSGSSGSCDLVADHCVSGGGPPVKSVSIAVQTDHVRSGSSFGVEERASSRPQVVRLPPLNVVADLQQEVSAGRARASTMTRQLERQGAEIKIKDEQNHWCGLVTKTQLVIANILSLQIPQFRHSAVDAIGALRDECESKNQSRGRWGVLFLGFPMLSTKEAASESVVSESSKLTAILEQKSRLDMRIASITLYDIDESCESGSLIDRFKDVLKDQLSVLSDILLCRPFKEKIKKIRSKILNEVIKKYRSTIPEYLSSVYESLYSELLLLINEGLSYDDLDLIEHERSLCAVIVMLLDSLMSSIHSFNERYDADDVLMAIYSIADEIKLCVSDTAVIDQYYESLNKDIEKKVQLGDANLLLAFPETEGDEVTKSQRSAFLTKPYYTGIVFFYSLLQCVQAATRDMSFNESQWPAFCLSVQETLKGVVQEYVEHDGSVISGGKTLEAVLSQQAQAAKEETIQGSPDAFRFMHAMLSHMMEPLSKWFEAGVSLGPSLCQAMDTGVSSASASAAVASEGSASNDGVIEIGTALHSGVALFSQHEVRDGGGAAETQQPVSEC
jgi:hypothetical protein